MNSCKYISIAIYITFLLLNKIPADAQSGSVDSLLIKALNTDELLPILIGSALKYSPEIKKMGSNQDYVNANLLISKKAIFSAVNLHSSYMYGTNYSAINNQSGPVSGNNFTTAQTGFYNVGIGMQLPLTYIINRKNIIKAGKSQVNMATADKENSELSVKQEVIRLYQEFKLSQKMMTISTKNRQAAQVNNTMAEKDFVNGQLTIDRLSLVHESYNKSIIDFETNVNRFQTSYMQLEAFTGINLSALIMQVK